MAVSNSRCSTPITTSTAFCRSTSTTPSGVEVRAHLRRLVRHIRRRWPDTHITFRGDGHYACPEAMTWCEQNGIDYVFGLAGTKPLARKVDEASDAVRTKRCLLYTSPSPRDGLLSRMPSSA